MYDCRRLLSDLDRRIHDEKHQNHGVKFAADTITEGLRFEKRRPRINATPKTRGVALLQRSK